VRIIFLSMTFDPEPGALRGLPLAKWLAARGHEVKVLTGFPQYPTGRIYPGYRMQAWQWDAMDNIPILRVPIYPSHDHSAIRRSLTYLSFALSAATIGIALIGSADAVFLCESQPTNALAAFLLKLFRRVPIVCNIADMWPESVTSSGMVRGAYRRRTISLLLGLWCRCLYRQAGMITVLSPGFKRLLIERGVPAEKIKVIYNWTDEDKFHPVDPDPVLAQELGFTGKFNIVYAGNLGSLQAVDTIIKAAALVKGNSNIQIVIIGSGPKEDELRSLCAEINAHNVRFLNRRQPSEMPKIYSLADVLLVNLKDIPFLHSTIPSKTQVSLASGRPILMGARGDAADLVLRARAAVVCEPENAQDMARGMTEMWMMPKEELEAMGARGRDFYLNNLSLDIAGKQMDAVFGRVMETRWNKAEANLTTTE
jgi:colanic acid biosynthesis glycosyl transferase WcaI